VLETRLASALLRLNAHHPVSRPIRSGSNVHKNELAVQNGHIEKILSVAGYALSELLLPQMNQAIKTPRAKSSNACKTNEIADGMMFSPSSQRALQRHQWSRL
jgi:hypothetical protein